MPFALTFIGMLLIITGFQDTYAEFGTQVQKDFSGPDSFIWWIVSLGVVGAVGYIPKLEHISRLFIVLIILSLFLTKGKGFFDMLNGAINSGSTASVNPIGANVTGAGSSDGNASGDSGIGGLVKDAGTIAEIASFF